MQAIQCGANPLTEFATREAQETVSAAVVTSTWFEMPSRQPDRRLHKIATLAALRDRFR